MPIIVLTTLGAKSGKLRKTALMRVEHDGEYAIVASIGGAPKHPLWYYNVVAHPHVELQDVGEKHDYVARGVASHPAFEIAVVTDEANVADWAHERNQQLADHFRVPYVRDIDAVLREDDIHVAIVIPEGPRHCALSIQAARAGKHVVHDKPLATRAESPDAPYAGGAGFEPIHGGSTDANRSRR